MQIFELTPYSHVALFVDSHVKFTCPKQSVSKTPPLHGAQHLESVLIIICHIIDTVLTFSLSCVCAAGKISRFSTLDFAA